MLKAYLKLLNGEMTVVTDTVIMAKEFGLIHKNLLKKARTIASEVLCDSVRRAEHSTRLTDNNNDRTAESPAHLFIDSEYTDSQSKSRPKVILTEEGFYYVVMEISHAKGKEQRELLRKIKRDFVKEFFVMRKHIDKLLKALRLLVEKFAPHDDNGHISIVNMKKRLNAVKGYVTSNKTGTPLTDEDMELLREVYQMEEFVDIKKESVLKHERNKKSRSKESVPCKTALEMRETGVISKKEAEQNGVYQQGIFRF